VFVPTDTKTITAKSHPEQPLSDEVVERIDRPLSRAEMVATMDAYRDHTWAFVEENRRNPCDSEIVSDIAISCPHPTRFVWPAREAKQPYPNPMKGLPYDWGGAGSIAGFDRKLARGFAAGNIGDTFWADGAIRVTAGVDCSGFLSRIWQLGRHVPTADVYTVTAPLAAINDMRTGDAFLKAGSHVMLHREQLTLDGASLSIRVTEASSRCGSVCDSIYEVDRFHDFTLRRRGQNGHAVAARAGQSQ
jgi:hypothetical protein